MKNRTIISMAIVTMISCPAFATGIGASAQNADCDNDVLGTYTGPASLSANWTANTINLDFYDGETKLSSGTCTYDGGIELPEDPTKTGYEFDGWKVRRAAAAQTSFDLTTLAEDINVNGNTYYFKFRPDRGSGLGPITCMYRSENASYDNFINCDDHLVGNLELGESNINFGYGTIKGLARCSNIGAGYSSGQVGNPTDDYIDGAHLDGTKYCWCSVIGFDPEKDGTFLPVTSAQWVYRSKHNSGSADCINACPSFCAQWIYSNATRRATLYGISQ